MNTTPTANRRVIPTLAVGVCHFLLTSGAWVLADAPSKGTVQKIGTSAWTALSFPGALLWQERSVLGADLFWPMLALNSLGWAMLGVAAWTYGLRAWGSRA